MSCNETKSSWKLVEDVWSPNSFMEDNIEIFKRPGANYMAYKINRHAINSNEIIYENEYKPLENSFGIYFLYKRENIPIDKKKYKTVTHIYVGRTSGSSSTGGMKRLVQHVLNDEADGKSYADKWDKALFVCLADDTGFNLGEIAAIEQVFIELFRGLDKNTNYPDSLVSIRCHNRKVGDRNNTPVQDYKAHVEAIKDLLINDSIGMIHPDIKGVYLSETSSALSQSVSNEVLARQYELQDALDTATRQLEEQNRELEKYRKSGRKKFSLLDIKKLEDEFKASYFKSLDTYKENLPNIENDRVYTQADLICGKESKEVITPMWIAKDMTKLIPDEDITEDTKFLCIYSKDEAFPNALLRRVVYNLSDKSPLYHKMSPVERLRHFVSEQLYIIVPNSECYNNTMYNLMGSLPSRFEYSDGGIGPLDPNWRDHIENFVTPHIVEIHNMQTLVKSSVGVEYIQERIEEEFKTVKFDVVIGNPPYNNDLYLDFVQLGYQLSSNYVCMITPAKWQAKTDGKPAGSKTPDKNEQFRETIAPHMSKIVYYKDSTDIFNIEEWGGISYFLIDKDIHNIKKIKSICSKNKVLNSEYEDHDEIYITLLPRNILSIIGKAGQLGEGFKQSLYVKNTDHGESSIAGQLGFKRFTYTSEQERGEKLKQAGYVEVMQGDKVVGYKDIRDLFTQINIDKYKCIASIMPGAVAAFDTNGKVLGMFKIVSIKPYQVPKGSFPVLMYYDTQYECDSFISFMNTKLVAFLYYLGTCGTTLTKEFFRFVPDPNDWTCTYVDAPHPNVVPDEKGYYTLDGKKYCSLYARYKLTPEEINIIESVIKERKQK